VKYHIVEGRGLRIPGFDRLYPRLIHTLQQRVQACVDQGLDVCVHLHSLIYPLNTLLTTGKFDPRVRWFVQHHAESPGRAYLNALAHRAYRHASGIFFSSHELGQPWVEAGVIKTQQIQELMECTSLCTPVERATARQDLATETTLLLLWTGNLLPNKDPLLVLKGLEQFMQDYPQAKLLMLYRDDTLLPEVQNLIARSAVLSRSVDLIGKVPFNEVGQYYSAADIFIQGSHREAAGIAVMDALCCGAIPVVTDIPSFRVLCGDTGMLWPAGDQAAFVARLRRLMDADLESMRAQCMARFQSHWSMHSLARRAIKYYFPLAS